LIIRNPGGGMEEFVSGRQFVEIALIQNVDTGTRISHDISMHWQVIVIVIATIISITAITICF